MYFLKAIYPILFLLILVDGFTEGSSLHEDNMMGKVVLKSRELKQEIDKLYQVSKERCKLNASTSRDADYEKIVSDYLNAKFSLPHEYAQVSQEQQQEMVDHPTGDQLKNPGDHQKNLGDHQKNLTEQQKNSKEQQKILIYQQQNSTDNPLTALNQQHEYSNHTKTEITHSKESFFTKLKHFFSNIFGKSKNHPETRLKRCLMIHLIGLELLDSQKIAENGTVNLTASDVQEFDKFLHNFIQCLNTEFDPSNETQMSESEECGEGFNVSPDTQRDKSSGVTPSPEKLNGAGPDLSLNFEQTPSTEKPPSPTSPIPSTHVEPDSNLENLLRYLAHSKHSIQELAHPNYKPFDLQEVKSLVAKMKHIQLFDEVNADLAKTKAKRNVFKDLGEKIKKIKKKLWKNSRAVKNSEFEKIDTRKSSELFKNIDVLDDEVPNYADSYKVVKEDLHNEEEPPAPKKVRKFSESESLLSELNDLQSKLSSDQQLEVSTFLDHINDKPKPFKFDTTPYLLSELEKSNRPAEGGQEDSEKIPEEVGARKYFEFGKKKRSLYSDEDYQKIAKLKSKLIDEYRFHHPIVDFSQILRSIDEKKEKTSEKSDDFIDAYYRLNDGSSPLEEIVTSHKTDNSILSPFELNLSFQLDNDFKDLNTFDFNNQKSNPLDFNAPLYKPEIEENKEFDEFSP